MNRFEAPFPRGNCPVFSFGPDDKSVPVVLFFPDAFGPREASFAVADEIAAQGWRVLMPSPTNRSRRNRCSRKAPSVTG